MSVHPCDRQNDVESLRRLKAASNRYNVAKRLLGVRAAAALLAPIVFIYTGFFSPSLEYWGAAYGLLAVILNHFLLQKYFIYKQQGAKAQELFDCRVLNLDWNTTELGTRPTQESIVEWADTFDNQHNQRPLTDWYPTALKELPLDHARIAIQRVGTQWDYSLRTRFIRVIVVLIGALILVLGGIALHNDWSLRTFVIVGTTFLPTLGWTSYEYRAQNRASEARKRLRSRLNRIWQGSITNEVTDQQTARQIQDALYFRRASDLDVFSWIYLLFRASDEARMRRLADKLVQQWKDETQAR